MVTVGIVTPSVNLVILMCWALSQLYRFLLCFPWVDFIPNLYLYIYGSAYCHRCHLRTVKCRYSSPVSVTLLCGSNKPIPEVYFVFSPFDIRCDVFQYYRTLTRDCPPRTGKFDSLLHLYLMYSHFVSLRDIAIWFGGAYARAVPTQAKFALEFLREHG